MAYRNGRRENGEAQELVLDLIKIHQPVRLRDLTELADFSSERHASQCVARLRQKGHGILRTGEGYVMADDLRPEQSNWVIRYFASRLGSLSNDAQHTQTRISELYNQIPNMSEAELEAVAQMGYLASMQRTKKMLNGGVRTSRATD